MPGSVKFIFGTAKKVIIMRKNGTAVTIHKTQSVEGAVVRQLWHSGWDTKMPSTFVRDNREHFAVPVPYNGGNIQYCIDQLNADLQLKTLELEQSKEQLARVTSKLIVAEQRERRRIAQLLHDDLQQLLVGASYALQTLAKTLSKDDDNPVKPVMEIIDEAMRASRSLTMHLAPPPILHEKGLAAGLQWLVRWMKDKHGLTVDLVIDEAAKSSRDDICTLLFQAVRELLLNVVKHAGVNRAIVELAMPDPDLIALTVSDEGAGFDPAAIWNAPDSNATGFGLPAIRERLNLLGGWFDVLSAPGRGSRFNLVCPLPARSA